MIYCESCGARATEGWEAQDLQDPNRGVSVLICRNCEKKGNHPGVFPPRFALLERI